ncbi:DUF192 domain-containing protein [Desulfogranum japonicum]|uniref:DUF192 domain-containing protein n=1 Tax=Desulfogranum japonicum TaxID=231447 RepID=UPI000413BDE4|nr:DUF192 domain-containing protein [Desulfogranum japonicum]
MNNNTKIIQLERAETMMSRLVGLLGRSGLGSGHGLLISPCNQVHTFFMRFVIDVVFLDSENHIVKICPAMRPWRLSPMVFKAKAVLELPEGESAGLEVGEQLILEQDRIVLSATLDV